jgi:hypothetical protein
MDRCLGKPLPHQQANPPRAHLLAINLSFTAPSCKAYPVLALVSQSYPKLKGRFPRVTHPCATDSKLSVRLACVKHAASVRSEPGSNSHVKILLVFTVVKVIKPKLYTLTAQLKRQLTSSHKLSHTFHLREKYKQMSLTYSLIIPSRK